MLADRLTGPGALVSRVAAVYNGEIACMDEKTAQKPKRKIPNENKYNNNIKHGSVHGLNSIYSICLRRPRNKY